MGARYHTHLIPLDVLTCKLNKLGKKCEQFQWENLLEARQDGRENINMILTQTGCAGGRWRWLGIVSNEGALKKHCLNLLFVSSVSVRCHAKLASLEQPQRYDSVTILINSSAVKHSSQSLGWSIMPQCHNLLLIAVTLISV
jgi:hypothetical protein